MGVAAGRDPEMHSGQMKQLHHGWPKIISCNMKSRCLLLSFYNRRTLLLCVCVSVVRGGCVGGSCMRGYSEGECRDNFVYITKVQCDVYNANAQTFLAL